MVEIQECGKDSQQVEIEKCQTLCTVVEEKYERKEKYPIHISYNDHTVYYFVFMDAAASISILTREILDQIH